ncbi:MAG: amidase [Leptospiraceae bacterium]|nr:amidase [Leptospiraceae bacterium]
MQFESARSIAAKIRNREITAAELVRRTLAQIEDRNKELNAIVTLNPQALAEARAADEALAAGRNLGPLHGVPIVVKDSYATRGLRTTAGYLPLKDFIPTEDSVVVALLKDAGAIIVGKGNLPTLAMDMQTNNPVFGRTNNPWDPKRTPGGSSGGDVTALAAGMAYLGFGSDLAGSLRVPAAFTGVYSLKTSYGVVSKQGHIPPLPDQINGLHGLVVMGPIARSIDDLELALQVIAQPHPRDKTMRPLVALTGPDSQLTVPDLKIAWIDSFAGVPVQAEIRRSMQAFVQRLAQAGAKVTRVEPGKFDYNQAWQTWGGLVGHQGAYETSNCLRWIGDFFTSDYTAQNPMLRQVVGPISVPRYMQLKNSQAALITQMDNFLDEYDIWIVPVSSTTAFEHMTPERQFGDLNVYETPILVDGQPVPYYVATQSYTTIFALTENPVLTMPIGLDTTGLPIGVQVVGRRFLDRRLLKIGGLIDPYGAEIHYPAEKQVPNQRDP